MTQRRGHEGGTVAAAWRGAGLPMEGSLGMGNSEEQHLPDLVMLSGRLRVFKIDLSESNMCFAHGF